MRLYRAAQDDYLGCLGETRAFARRLDDARAYLDNPGFGGATLYRLKVDVHPCAVLDTRDDGGMRQLCAIVGLSESELAGRAAGAPAVEALHRPENVALVLALAAAGVRWLVHEDSYPVECETWTLVSGDWTDELELEPVE